MIPVHVAETPRVVVSRIQWHDMNMRGQGLACENSCLSSLPVRMESRETPLGPGAKEDGCFRRLVEAIRDCCGMTLHTIHLSETKIQILLVISGIP